MERRVFRGAIKLVEDLVRPARSVGSAGTVEGSRQMRRRMARIARLGPTRRAWSVLAGAMALLLVGGFLTDAVVTAGPKARTAPDSPAPDSFAAIWLKRLRADAENTSPIRVAELELRKARAELQRLEEAAKAGKWRLLAPLPGSRSGLASFVLREKLYAVGGEGPRSGRFSRDVYRYDPPRDRWEKLRPFPSAIWDAACAVVGDKAYVMGGRHGYGATQPHVYAYDPHKDTWQKETNMPTPVMHAGAAPHRGKIYVFGGTHRQRESHSQVVAKLQIYDVADDAWTVKDMPWALYPAKAVTVGSDIWVFAARLYETPKKAVPCQWILRYAIATNKWHRVPFDPPEGFQNTTPVVAIGNKLYLTDVYTKGWKFPRIAYELGLPGN